MLFSILFFLYSLTFPLLVIPLECYSCEDPIVVNNYVTNQTIPSFSQCQLVNGTQCMIYVHWDLDKNKTSIAINALDSMMNEDTIMPMTFMNIGVDQNDFLSGHSLLYFCMSSNQCNSEIYLKKILSSLEIKDKFREELSSLLQIVPSFNPKTAECFDLNNSTNECSPKDINLCPRCQIIIETLNSSSREVCATCPIDPINANTVSRAITFSLTHQKQINEYVRLNCQLKQCNSIENINQVYNTSTIIFNFKQFYSKN